MREKLLRHYESELRHIRQTAADFAREYPKIAGRLGVDPSGQEICNDPFVERLLEGFAYLTARVQLKFDAEFPRLTQSLLESVYPHYLAPTPSMLIAGFEPEADAALAAGYPIPRGTTLRANLGRGGSVPAQFRTAHDVTLWPLEIRAADYTTREAGTFELPSRLRPKAVLRLRMGITAGIAPKELKVDTLDVYLRGGGDLPYRLLEQVLAHGASVVLQSGSGAQRKTVAVRGGTGVQAMGFAGNESLFPVAPRSFEGYRLLREYFVFPQRYLFFRLTGLREAVAQMSGTEFDVLVLLDGNDVLLENRVDDSMFALFCTPAINLFSKRVDRISLSDKFSEYQIIADKTRTVDYEIFDLQRVEGIGNQADETYRFTPFYFNYERDLNSRAYYTLNRVERTLNAREVQQGGVRYPGSEVYLSLVDGNNAPYSPSLQQLSVTALCTNRHLPLSMPVGVGKTDFHLDINAPVSATRALTSPTEPVPSLAHGEMSWRIISHLALNYLSLVDSNPEEGAVALRELLRLYAEHPSNPQANTSLKKIIGALQHVSSKPIVRRVLTPGPIAFARGLEITLEVRESEFSGNSAFLFGAVLEQFFAKYVSINSFTETVLRSERGEIKRWTARPGARDVL